MQYMHVNTHIWIEIISVSDGNGMGILFKLEGIEK